MQLVEIERAIDKGSYFNKISQGRVLTRCDNGDNGRVRWLPTEEELGMEHDMQQLLAKHQLEGMDPVKVRLTKADKG